jgi:low temperature requirement protein LtrA
MAEEQLEHRVLPLELFFDLVFVFAITQVTGFLAHDPTWARLAESLAVLAALWWAWSCYAWQENTIGSEDGPQRAILLAAMAATLVASLAVPRVFGRDGLLFGAAYLAIVVLHIGSLLAASRDGRVPRSVVWRLAGSLWPSAGLILLAGAFGGTPRAVLWIAALITAYGGLAVGGAEGWRVDPGHFAERHGLIFIIALGEGVVSIGVGVGALSLSVGVLAGALAGLAVAAALWWAYFDVVAKVGERELRRRTGVARARMARDSYTYLHLPMVTGIVLFAFGVKKTLGHLDVALNAVPAVSLCCGVALSLLALSAFKRRNIGSFNQPRLVAAAVLTVLAPIATAVPALAALGLVAGVTCALIAYEVVAYAPARVRIRSEA